MGAEYYKDLLEPHYEGGHWIITADAAAGAIQNAQRLLDTGAAGVMVIGGTAGTGADMPEGVEVYILGTTGETMMDGIRAFQAALDEPPPQLCAAIDAWDPERSASVLANFLNSDGDLCGRRVLGASLPRWKALEDKMIVDDLFDRAGVERPPSVIVDSRDETAVNAALDRFGGPAGAVVVADNRKGWHGGGEYARYLAPTAQRDGTLAFFREHADEVRVAPFLQGTPCSIHGLVLPDRVLAFRPIEMLVYRRPGHDEFVYCGMDRLWDPPDEVRRMMREAVRRVGDLIRADVGYRGVFGIDGVCTRDGFLPTELNPRLTAGLGIQTQAAGNYPMGDINRAVIMGLDIDLRPGRLEAEIVAGADAKRGGRWLRPISHISLDESRAQPIRWDGVRWHRCEEDAASAVMHFGPSAQGALVFVRLDEDHGLPVGESIASIAAASFALADELWDTRIGELIPGTA